MKTILGVFGCSLLTVALVGCGPELAQTQLGAKEQAWQSAIKQSYPSWNPPPVAPPAIRDNMSKDFVDTPEETPVPTDPDVDEPVSAAEATDVPAPATDDLTVASETETVTVVTETAAPDTATAAEPDTAVAGASDAAGTEEIYTVQKGDSLSLIAKKFYKDGRKYHRILKANNDVLKGNPNRLRPGMKLRIPAL